MPPVLHRAPRWLDHGTFAHSFFHTTGDSDKATETERDGASRKIAHRGSEVFFAVGRDIRWSALGALKEGGQGDSDQVAYKTLKTPAAHNIQHITIAPSGDFIAVITSHTCHVCLLPPRDALNYEQHTSLKLRSFMLGPTAHVLDRAPLVSALWHPLSHTGNCLVTVTDDACVRLWELDQNNRASFNEPDLAVDLKKLGNASSRSEDFSASKYGTNKGYSVDEVEMQVAASCFGGQGRDDEDGWSSMTLWIAMAQGDVYALCPFLPSQFTAPHTMMPSLSTSVVAKERMLSYDKSASEWEKRVAIQQRAWLTDLDQQDPLPLYDMDVYSRPAKPGAVPRLQGPFLLTPELDFGEITDIHVIAPKITQDDLFDTEEEYDDYAIEEGLSVGIVVLATQIGHVHISLNIEGVEAEWLPSKRSQLHVLDEGAVKSLLRFETLLTAPDNQQGYEAWPTFTASPVDRYELFTTQPTGIYSISFRPWITILEEELSASEAESQGISFRLNAVLETAKTIVQQVSADFNEPLDDINATVAIVEEVDPDFIVLTSAHNQPIASVLALPTPSTHAFAPDTYNPSPSVMNPEIRAPYQPAEVFFQATKLSTHIERWHRESASGTTPGDIKGAISYSPYTLQKLADAHRILSSETHNLGLAAADLFRRCERMVNEMKAQVDRVRELSNRVNSVTGEDEFPEQRGLGERELVRGGKTKIENRIQQRRDKTQEIQERVERLRRKMRGLGGRELSLKERMFAEEVDRISRLVIAPSPTTTGSANPTGPAGLLKMENSTLTAETEATDEDDQDPESLVARFNAVQEVYQPLLEQATLVQKELEDRIAAGGEEDGSRPSTAAGAGAGRSGNAYRQRKMDEVWALLERESALVEAVGKRLEGLQMAAK